MRNGLGGNLRAWLKVPKPKFEIEHNPRNARFPTIYLEFYIFLGKSDKSPLKVK